MPSLTNAVIVALLAVSTVVVAARLATAPHQPHTASQSASLVEAPPPAPPMIQAPRARRPAPPKPRELPAELPPRPDHTVAHVVPDVAAPGTREGTEDEGDSPVTPERQVVEGPSPARPVWRPRIPDDADRLTVRHLRDVVVYLKSLEGAGSEP